MTKSLWILKTLFPTQLLFNYSLFSNFPTIKNHFLLVGWLEISERLGNCRLCFLGNEIWTNVNASSWITYEQNSSMELFLSILVSSPSISLLRHISSIPCQLKPCLLGNTAFWLDHPLATLQGKPEQAFRGKLSWLVFT